MKTKLVIKLLLLLLPAIAFYLLGAFTAWDLNPATWNAFGRFVLAFLSIAAVVGLIIHEVES